MLAVVGTLVVVTVEPDVVEVPTGCPKNCAATFNSRLPIETRQNELKMVASQIRPIFLIL